MKKIGLLIFSTLMFCAPLSVSHAYSMGNDLVYSGHAAPIVAASADSINAGGAEAKQPEIVMIKRERHSEAAPKIITKTVVKEVVVKPDWVDGLKQTVTDWLFSFKERETPGQHDAKEKQLIRDAAKEAAKEASNATIKSITLPFLGLVALIIVGFIGNALYGKRNSDRIEEKVDSVPLRTTEEILTHNVVGNVASINLGCWLVQYRPEFVDGRPRSLYVPKAYVFKKGTPVEDIPTTVYDTVAQVATSMKSIIKIDADGKFISSSMSPAQWEVIKRESDGLRLTISRVS